MGGEGTCEGYASVGIESVPEKTTRIDAMAAQGPGVRRMMFLTGALGVESSSS